jgi:uncharacterized caspase-like protein
MNGYSLKHALYLFSLTLMCLGQSARAEDLPRKYALLIGVDKYEKSADLTEAGVPQLQYAVKDASQLAVRLENQGFTTTVLNDTLADRRTVITHLLRFADVVREQDTFVLYYAGHGVRRAATGQVYWLNYDGDPLRPDISGLRVSYLIDLVREIPAKRKLVLLDHCYAAEITLDQPGSLPNVTLAPGGRSAGSREATSSASVHVTANARDALPMNVEAQTDRAAKQLVVMAASRGVAFELATQEHGIFTYALLNALSTTDADTAAGGGSSDGALTISELIRYLRVKVHELSKDAKLEQKPFAKPYGDDVAELLEWAPFLRDLMANEIGPRAQLYNDTLRKWSGKHLIEPAAQAECETVLTRWQHSPDSLSPKDLQIISALRELIDNPPPVSDQEITNELGARLASLRSGP